MLNEQQIKLMNQRGRSLQIATTGDIELGPLKQLPGVWKNTPNLPGRGWNMIALPFATAPSPLNYRLLMNQYNETLKFSLIGKGIPNRGISDQSPAQSTDQFLASLDYEQTINQIDAEDSPVSGLAGSADLAIHHEPGLWLNLANEDTDGLDIARLATIPHGDSVLAMGRAIEIEGAPSIPIENGLPIGVDQNLEHPYLAPYKHFHDNPFNNLFDPVNPNQLLTLANQSVNIVKTTELEVDTTFATGGIVNIPFITKQANASDMKARFWIQELAELDKDGNPKLRLQYSQTVFLDFFERRDGQPGLIRWPHVSINTLEKVVE